MLTRWLQMDPRIRDFVDVSDGENSLYRLNDSICNTAFGALYDDDSGVCMFTLLDPN